MAFSNRMFPTKVVSLWLKLSDEERVQMVMTYFLTCGADFIAMATRAMVGADQLPLPDGVEIALEGANDRPLHPSDYVGVKVPMFSFKRLLGADPTHVGIVVVCALSIGFATPPLVRCTWRLYSKIQAVPLYDYPIYEA